MRLAFSTLGMPGLPLSEVATLVAGGGFHGVELRVHPEEPVHTGLRLTQRVDVVEEFKEAGVEILALAGYARVAEAGEDEPVLDEVRALAELARDLGARAVRVFPGGGEQSREEADATAARRLARCAPLAADLGVRLLLETHDSHASAAAAARVAARVGHPSVGVLWDTLHTWRAGETPAESYAALHGHLGYAQVKDAPSRVDTTPLPPGEGAVPLDEVVRAVCASEPPDEFGTGAWLCWEYEKRWFPEAPSAAPLLTEVARHLRGLHTSAVGEPPLTEA